MCQDQRVFHIAGPELDRMMPMHLVVDSLGQVISAGPTLQKLLAGRSGDLAGIFENGRAEAAPLMQDHVRRAAEQGDRLFLRLCHLPEIGLRGHATAIGDGRILINLGFGIDLADAVGAASLTDADFAPPELALELLFMREAMHGVLAELSRFNKQLKHAREMAEIEAHTDPLTGLRNRRGLELALNAAFAAEKAQNGRGFALAHIDLDNFKLVNDVLGHPAGDALLSKVASLLIQATRGHDTVARFGGDEFIILLRDLTDVATLERLASRIISGIEGVLDPIENCRVSASIGIVVSTGYRELSIERMLRDVDSALYQSKREGRARVTVLRRPLADCL